MSFFHKHVLDKKRWALVRLKVLDAANWQCSACKQWANEVDHIRALNLGGDQYALDNLQALCGGAGGCHAAKTRQELRKVAPDQKEWQEFMGARNGVIRA